MKSFKQTINWNKYNPKVSVQAPDPYFDFLINPRFQGVNRLFVLSFETHKILYSNGKNKGL